jgi:hypothetical protein
LLLAPSALLIGWQAEQLYIGAHDVQTQPMDFLNKIAGWFVI